MSHASPPTEDIGMGMEKGPERAFAPEGDVESGGDALRRGGIRVAQEAENADVVGAAEASPAGGHRR